MSFISELKRRHVFQVGVAYLVVAWGVAQVAELIFDTYDTQSWVMQMILAVLAIERRLHFLAVFVDLFAAAK